MDLRNTLRQLERDESSTILPRETREQIVGVLQLTKVYRLSYRGENLESRLGILFFPTPGDLHILERKLRNLIP